MHSLTVMAKRGIAEVSLTQEVPGDSSDDEPPTAPLEEPPRRAEETLNKIAGAPNNSIVTADNLEMSAPLRRAGETLNKKIPKEKAKAGADKAKGIKGRKA